MSRNNRVFLLSRRWPHHSGHSGYDLFGRYVGKTLTADSVPRYLVPDRFVERLQQKMRGYDRTGLGLEIRAARHMATHTDCVYHILYGDNCYYFLGNLNGWRGHRVIASFHHPPQKFAYMVRDMEKLSKLSAVVVVGKNQISSFTGLAPKERIFHIPHPVDTNFFVPPSDFDSREENLCLFVGAHLRDIETLCRVIEDAWIRAPELKFVVVAHPDQLTMFENIVGNLEIFSGISEEKLRGLYQKAAMLLQPLHDTTANNTVLEASSSGLPIIVTNVGAIGEYIDEESAIFVPAFDSSAMLDAILELVNDPDRRRRMSEAGRRHASKFEWSVLAQQMIAVYDQVLGYRKENSLACSVL